MRRAALLLTAAAVVTTAGCKSPEQKAAEEATKNMAEVSRRLDSATKAGNVNIGDAMAAMGAAVSGTANGGKKVETVDYHKLKDLLPESLPGMRRTEATGEKNAPGEKLNFLHTVHRRAGLGTDEDGRVVGE